MGHFEPAWRQHVGADCAQCSCSRGLAHCCCLSALLLDLVSYDWVPLVTEAVALLIASHSAGKRTLESLSQTMLLWKSEECDAFKRLQPLVAEVVPRAAEERRAKRQRV